MKRTIYTLCIALCLAVTACDKPKEDAAADPPDETKTVEPAEEPAEDTKEEPAEAAAKVELTAAGAKLDPAVKPEQLPDGAWYCDMGTVHWAATDKPEDGKCPECGMALKQYASADHAAQKAKAIEAKPEEHGHEHGEGGHGHDHDEHGHEH